MRATDSYRKEHSKMKKGLLEVKVKLNALAHAPLADQKKVAKSIVHFFKDEIKAKDKWEEHVLYPAIDKFTHSTKFPFTSTMRYEHTILDRWIENLEKESAKRAFNAKNFISHVQHLIGFVKAHFEEEEKVLLPILDKNMTKADFQKNLYNKSKRHARVR